MRDPYHSQPAVHVTWADHLIPGLIFVMNEYLPYDTHESVPTQQRERMVVDQVNEYQKL